MSDNIASRVAESISVLCPVCGERATFRPSVTGVTVRNAVDAVEPVLYVGLQPGNVVAHACQEVTS
jgi:hypothetical protein